MHTHYLCTSFSSYVTIFILLGVGLLPNLHLTKLAEIMMPFEFAFVVDCTSNCSSNGFETDCPSHWKITSHWKVGDIGVYNLKN